MSRFVPRALSIGTNASGLVLVIPVLVLSLRSYGQDQPRPKSESDPRILTLEARAAAAKAAGRSQVFFSTPIEDPVFTTGLMDILSRYSAVIASPIAQEVVDKKTRMVTWYALDVESELIHHLPAIPLLGGVDSLSRDRRPESLLPIAGTNTLLIWVPGGTTVIDGVTVTEHSNGDRAIELNKRYLFIIDMSADRTLGYLPVGLAGVFSIAPDDDTLTTMTSRRHEVTDDVKSPKFKGLSKIRTALANANHWHKVPSSLKRN